PREQRARRPLRRLAGDRRRRAAPAGSAVLVFDCGAGERGWELGGRVRGTVVDLGEEGRRADRQSHRRELEALVGLERMKHPQTVTTLAIHVTTTGARVDQGELR